MKEEKSLQPPLVEILKSTETVRSNMRDLEQRLNTCIEEEAKKELKKELGQTKALLRNLNLLIIDIFKEFD